MGRKEIATAFLEAAASGDVRQAYERHVHPRFRHHNVHFRGDPESLLAAIEENARQFPDKTYEVLRALEDGDLVAVHGRVTLSADSQWSVIHICRFDGDRIVEMWEASQEALADSPNENGLF